MGKRKNQAADHPKTIVSDHLSNPSEMEAFSAQKSSHQVESNAITPNPSLIQQLHDSVNLPQSSLSPTTPHNYLNHSILLRNPRYCNRKYSRRNSTCHADASTSQAKDIALLDEKITLKLNKKCVSDNPTVQAEVGDQEAQKLERIRSSSLTANTVSVDMKKMVCGICGKFLRKKPMNVGNSLSLSEPSVVAVLVCGHLYHADCLEQKTSQEEKTDPSCPTCMNLTSRADSSVASE